MAANQNDEMYKDLVDLDPDEIALSAFANEDEFKPKVFNKHKAFGKKRSFVCFRNIAFDSSLDELEDESEPIQEAMTDLTDFPETSTDERDIESHLPSRVNRQRPGSLKQRKVERLQMSSDQSLPTLNRSQKTISGWKQFKYSLSMSVWQAKTDIKGFFKDIDIWKSNLKPIEGKFGSGVLSYFLFLRWLFLLDLMISFLIIAFILSPQLMYRPSFKTNNNTFGGLELLTGEGWFLPTEMYYGTYGGYSNDTVILSYNTPYNLPLAYLSVAGGYILLCVIILVRSMAVSYNKNYISGKDFRDSFFTTIFCSWDYAVTMENSASLLSRNICINLLETLNEGREKRKKTSDEKCCTFLGLLATNVIAVGLIGGACYAIRWVKFEGVTMVQDALPQTELSEVLIKLLPAISITTLNIVLPYMFRIIASIEEYESPQRTIEVSLLRTVVLKLGTLCVYIWLIYRGIEKDISRQLPAFNTTTTPVYAFNTTAPALSNCWETSVGVQLYQLAVVDLIFLLLATFFGETVRWCFANCMNAAGCNFDQPGFDIARNVLSLIYSQALCWLGSFFCPMLPLITIIKFFILFYYKKASVMSFCRPSMRPFKASKMQLRFFALLSLMLILAMTVIGLIVINEDRLKPSSNCGPFRERKSIFDTVQVVINRDFGNDLRNLTKGVASSIALFGIIFILWGMIYYQRLRKLSAEKKIKLLKEQIALAGQDKKYYLTSIREVLKGNQRSRAFSPKRVPAK